MLYLFGSGSYKGNRKVVKVGFTDDIETRKQQYLLHNPLGEFLGIRDGDRLLELKLHLRLEDYKVEFLDEWFYDEEEVEEIFGSTESQLNKWLWENRNTTLLDPEMPKQGTMKYEIYEELKSMFDRTGLDFGQKSL